MERENFVCFFKFIIERNHFSHRSKNTDIPAVAVFVYTLANKHTKKNLLWTICLLF